MATDKETPVAEHETPATDRTPEPAKRLTVGLLVWILAAALVVLGVYGLWIRG